MQTVTVTPQTLSVHTHFILAAQVDQSQSVVSRWWVNSDLSKCNKGCITVIPAKVNEPRGLSRVKGGGLNLRLGKLTQMIKDLS